VALTWKLFCVYCTQLCFEVVADVELAVQCIIVQRSGLEILLLYTTFEPSVSAQPFSLETASVNLQNEECQARSNTKNAPLL
jgi:hypothetical protein